MNTQATIIAEDRAATAFGRAQTARRGRPRRHPTEELHAFFNANKRVQIEQPRVGLVLRDDDQDGAQPRMGIDLDAGTAVVRRPR